MSKVVPIRPGADEGLEVEFTDLFVPGDFVDTLNGIEVGGAQLRAAVAAISHIQVCSDADVIEQGRLLSTFASENGLALAAFAGTALHARAIAMDRWCQAHDPFAQSDLNAFYDAGARAPLVRTEEGLGFDPKSFSELVQFIADIPY